MSRLSDVVLAYVGRPQGATAAEVATALGRNRSLIDLALRKLETTGLAAREVHSRAGKPRGTPYAARWHARIAVPDIAEALLAYVQAPATLEERFWARVDKEGPIKAHMTTPCWVWTGGTDTWGYGVLRDGGKQGRNRAAHRFSWELHQGSIPRGIRVLHDCDEPRCVNPGHLYLGTDKDNARDRELRGRKTPARGLRSGAYTHPECRPRGEAHGQAKLTQVATDSIRSDYATGMSSPALMAKYAVGRTTIYDILHNRRWVRT